MPSNIPLPSTQGTRPGYFAEITLVLLNIRDRRASGRLSIRNSEKFGLAHLYFRAARLVHVAGDKHGGEAVLQDLLCWSKGSFRFDDTALIAYDDVTWQQAQLFERWVTFLEMRGRVQGIPQQQLQGLTHSLTIMLPGKPIALAQPVEYRERYGQSGQSGQSGQPVESGGSTELVDFTLDRQGQRSGSITQHLIEQVLSQEQRAQVQQISHTARQQVGELVQQTRHVTRGLTRRVVQVTQEKLHQAADITQRTTRHTAIRAEDVAQRKEREDEQEKSRREATGA